jgi:hypothetical protein
MKIKLVFFTLLFETLTIVARADLQLTSLPSLTLNEQSHLRSAISASFHFRLEDGVDCTGTYISSSGHFITARHCVNKCLAKNQALTRELAIAEPTGQMKIGRSKDGAVLVRPVHTFKVTVDDDRVNDGIDCPGILNQQRVNMRIVLTGGKGWLSPSNSLASFSKLFPDEYQELLNDGYEHLGDFAILQVLGAKNSACLNFSVKAPAVGRNVQAVSYPCLERPTFLASGETALYTRGSRTTGFKESDYYKSIGEAKIPFNISTVQRNDTFFSTLDIEKCGSGTAVLDDNLNIVGIATRVYKSSTLYERGSLEAIDIAEVWREIKEKKPALLKTMTSCTPAPNG